MPTANLLNLTFGDNVDGDGNVGATTLVVNIDENDDDDNKNGLHSVSSKSYCLFKKKTNLEQFYFEELAAILEQVPLKHITSTHVLSTLNKISALFFLTS